MELLCSQQYGKNSHSCFYAFKLLDNTVYASRFYLSKYGDVFSSFHPAAAVGQGSPAAKYKNTGTSTNH